MVIRRFEEQPVAEDSDAAIADVVASLRLPCVVPDLPAGASINRPHVVGQSDVHDTIDHYRRRFDRCVEITAGYGAKDPSEAERIDVCRADLRKRTVAAAGIIAIVCWPG